MLFSVYSCTFCDILCDKNVSKTLRIRMMTSSNGNIFRVTGLLCGEFGHRWIPGTEASDAELWCFLWSAPGSTVEHNGDAGDLKCHRANYDVIVMFAFCCQCEAVCTTYTVSNGYPCKNQACASTVNSIYHKIVFCQSRCTWSLVALIVLERRFTIFMTLKEWQNLRLYFSYTYRFYHEIVALTMLLTNATCRPPILIMPCFIK